MKTIKSRISLCSSIHQNILKTNQSKTKQAKPFTKLQKSLLKSENPTRCKLTRRKKHSIKSKSLGQKFTPRINLKMSLVNLQFKQRINSTTDTPSALSTQKGKAKASMWPAIGHNPNHFASLRNNNMRIWKTKTGKENAESVQANQNVPCSKPSGQPKFKSLRSLIKTHNTLRRANNAPRKTRILNFFFKKQIQENAKKVKSKFRRSQRQLSKQRDTLTSSNDEEFNIFGDHRSPRKKSSFFGRTCAQAASCRPAKTTHGTLVPKRQKSKKSTFIFKQTDKEDRHIEHTKDEIQARIKCFLRQQTSGSSQVKFKQNGQRVMRPTVRLVHKGSSQDNTRVSIDRNMFFNRRKTRFELNMTPKGDSRKRRDSATEEVNYENFKPGNPNVHKKVDFEKVNKLNISLLKSPRSMMLADAKSRFRTQNRGGMISMLRLSSGSHSIDFSKRMKLPKGFGDSLNKRHFQVAPNEHLTNWTAVPRTIPVSPPKKHSKIAELQMIKYKNLAKLRRNYRTLFNRHVDQIKRNVASIFEKYSLDRIHPE